MAYKTPVSEEYEDRLDEILSFDVSNISSKEVVECFINKITDWVQFLEDNKSYKDKTLRIYDSEEVKLSLNDLLTKGNEILNDCRNIVERANETIKNQEIKLPTQSEVIEKHNQPGHVTTFSPTVDESLGSNLDCLTRRLKDDAQVGISEIPSVITETRSIKWDFDTLGITPSFTQDEIDNLSKLGKEYDAKNTIFERKRRYYGHTDFDTLHGIWEARTGKEMSERQLNFVFSKTNQLLEEDHPSYRRSPTYQEIIQELEDYKTKVKSVNMRLKETQTKLDYVWYKRFLRFIWKTIKWLFKFAIK